MKKFFTSMAIFLCLTAVGTQASRGAETIYPVKVEDSGCTSTRSDDPYSEDYDADKWTLQYNDGVLTVTWINFVANCCPDEFLTRIEKTDDNTLVFNVEAKEDWCDCLCSFDVTSTFEGLDPGNYKIIFRSYSNDIFTAEVEIKEGCDLTLEKAPSGIRTLAGKNELAALSADGILHVGGSENAVIEIYDASGTLRTKISTAPNSEIDITSLRRGLYIARITSENQSATIRFVR